MILTILLHIFLITGFLIGWLNGSETMKNSKMLYKDKSTIKYWLG
jgi:hypothetical protein